MLVNGKDAIYKILVEDDLIKTPEMEALREDPRVSSLISERDKATHKQMVSIFTDRANKAKRKKKEKFSRKYIGRDASCRQVSRSAI